VAAVAVWPGVASLAPFLMEAQEGRNLRAAIPSPSLKPAEAPGDQPAIPSEYKRPKDFRHRIVATFEANPPP